jgi:hypothetical protein
MTGVALLTASIWIPVAGTAADAGAAVTIIAPAAPTDATPATTNRPIRADIFIYFLPLFDNIFAHRETSHTAGVFLLACIHCFPSGDDEHVNAPQSSPRERRPTVSGHRTAGVIQPSVLSCENVSPASAGPYAGFSSESADGHQRACGTERRSFDPPDTISSIHANWARSPPCI